MATIDECVYGKEPAQLELNRLRETNKNLKQQIQEKQEIIDEATKMVEKLRADLRC